MVDPEILYYRLGRLDNWLRQLDRIVEEGKEAYLEDPVTRPASERYLQLALNTCIDIGTHVIAERGFAPPTDYAAVFTTLKGAGLDGELAERLKAAASMRTALVHYVDVDPEQVWSALMRLDDLRAFAAWVEELARETTEVEEGSSLRGSVTQLVSDEELIKPIDVRWNAEVE